MGEISRITDHLTCVGAAAMEIGAFTFFLWFIKAREYLWELIEQVSGARMTTNWTRFGGNATDLPDGFLDDLQERLDKVKDILDECDKMLEQLDMRSDVQEIFKLTPHDKQVMMFSATLSKEIRPVVRKFMADPMEIYVDDEANPRIRAACQGFIAFILWGVGAFVGTMLAGKVLAMYETTNAAGETVHDWAGIWPVPAWLSLGVLVVFFVFFREPERKPVDAA